MRVSSIIDGDISIQLSLLANIVYDAKEHKKADMRQTEHACVFQSGNIIRVKKSPREHVMV